MSSIETAREVPPSAAGKGLSRRNYLLLEVAAVMGTHVSGILGPLIGVQSSAIRYVMQSYCYLYTLEKLPWFGVALFVPCISGDRVSDFGVVPLRLRRDVTWAAVAAVCVALVSALLGIFHPASGLLYARPWHSHYVPSPLWFIAIHCLVTGSVEELIYRGYLLTRLREILRSTRWAWIVQAVFFGSVHMYQGPWGVLHACLFGLVLGAVFIRAKSIWPGAFVHALYDFWVYGMMLST